MPYDVLLLCLGRGANDFRHHQLNPQAFSTDTENRPRQI